MDTKQAPPGQRFFGRRKGPSLSARKESLVETLLPKLSVPVNPGAPAKLDPAALFDNPRDLWLEIGFGKGEHLAAQAISNPRVGLIGCEPYINGVASLLSQINEQSISNIRLYADDARHIIDALPDNSIDKIFLIHPDPWPKKRHAQRRFVNKANLDGFSRIMKPGGEFRVGTDHPVYREWVAIQMANRDDFEWQAEGAKDWRQKPADWPDTRYETKALEGKATYLIYKRTAD